MGRVRIRRASTASIITVIVLGIVCATFFVLGHVEFNKVQEATKDYIACENATRQLQSASNYLTEQARLAVETGDGKYIAAYYAELDDDENRNEALDTLKTHTTDAQAIASLESALNRSNDLAQTEARAMRLSLEASAANDTDLPTSSKVQASDKSTWPKEIRDVKLTKEDKALSADDKAEKARDLMFNERYETAKTGIMTSIQNCTDTLVQKTENRQGRTETVFTDIYLKIEVLVAIFALIAIGICVATRVLMVNPLMRFVDAVKRDEPFPVCGAHELQTLADTYNDVYQKSKERQLLIRHQAEHDPLTDLLNRRSYDRLSELYASERQSFALILCDVDIFKSVNDTYGHEMGDRILKHVSKLLVTTFRNIDYVCRIGGDEFAVIMVEMTPDLAYTITEKIDYINEVLQHPTDDLPAVSVSVGVAFSKGSEGDTAESRDELFRRSDAALYHTKENGRCGLTFEEDL